jgi:hypothetical protein
MSTEYSSLCGYSYAWQAGYKPKAFARLEKLLLSENPDPEFFAKKLIIKNPVLVEQIRDSYGKLGFLFLARDYIRKVNGKHPLAHIYVSYHLYNFIYDCKAFLDALAVMLNDFYSTGETEGPQIDLNRKPFREKVIKKEPKLEKIIRKYENWFSIVADWRKSLIHRFSTIVLPYISTDHRLRETTKEEVDQGSLLPCMMLVEPRPLLPGVFQELEKKYGKGNTFREIDPFCEEWINKTCDLYDQASSAIADKLDVCSGS